MVIHSRKMGNRNGKLKKANERAKLAETKLQGMGQELEALKKEMEAMKISADANKANAREEKLKLQIRHYQLVENSESHIEALLSNPGLNLIIIHISSYLEPKSMAQCRLVSKRWKDLIDNHRKWLIYQHEHIFTEEKLFRDRRQTGHWAGNPTPFISILERFPEWLIVHRLFSKESISRLKSYVRHMWIYFKDDRMCFYTNPLHDAAAKSNVEFVQLMIDCGIDIGMPNPNGSNPLHYACQQGNIDVVELLADHAKCEGAYPKGTEGLTIFQFAVQNPDPQVPKLIFDRFQFEDVPDDDGWTIFHYAARFGANETIEYLMEARPKLGFSLSKIPF